MRARTKAGIVVVAAMAVAGAGVSAAGGSATASGGSRLDDGGDLLPQSRITEADAIRAARSAAQGDLNEVDLERSGGRLVWNVDVGSSDVQVDASSGDVIRAGSDD